MNMLLLMLSLSKYLIASITSINCCWQTLILVRKTFAPFFVVGFHGQYKIFVDILGRYKIIEVQTNG